jgi:VRR-NUC domain
VPEKQWQATVVDAARLLGWKVFHPYDSRRSEPGWPDLTLVRPPRLVFVELKVHGRLTGAQRRWLSLLAACGAEAYLWRGAGGHCAEADGNGVAETELASLGHSYRMLT